MNIDSNNQFSDLQIPQRLPLRNPTRIVTLEEKNAHIVPGAISSEKSTGCFSKLTWCVVIFIFIIILLAAAAIATALSLLLKKNSENNANNITTTVATTILSNENIPTETIKLPSTTTNSSDTLITLTTLTTSTTTTACNGNGYILSGSNCDECGLTDYKPNVKIIGGVAAMANSWPAQVLVIFTYTFDYMGQKLTNSFLCGGTLISRYTILTAAHCIPSSFNIQYGGSKLTITVTPNKYNPTLASMFKVYLGINDVTFLNQGKKPPLPGVEAAVSDVIKHELYRSDTDVNDIALFILTSSITPNKYIKIACLPNQKSTTYPTANQFSYVAGWGTLSEGGSRPSVLYNVKLTVYDGSKCSSYPYFNNNNQVCAGEINGGKDSCQGKDSYLNNAYCLAGKAVEFYVESQSNGTPKSDSGGGLYIYDSSSGKERFVVSGIVSYGDGCARAGKLGVYTRTSNYLDWIKKNWKVS